jgi:hypothetical protein
MTKENKKFWLQIGIAFFCWATGSAERFGFIFTSVDWGNTFSSVCFVCGCIAIIWLILKFIRYRMHSAGQDILDCAIETYLNYLADRGSAVALSLVINYTYCNSNNINVKGNPYAKLTDLHNDIIEIIIRDELASRTNIRGSFVANAKTRAIKKYGGYRAWMRAGKI